MYRPKDNVVWRKKSDMLVLLNTATGQYYTVNQTGADLWDKLAVKSMTLDQALEEISAGYANAPDSAAIAADCGKMLREWVEESLFEEVPDDKGR